MTEEVEKKIDGLQVTNDEEEDDVNPWDVRAKDEKGIDYDKLISEFYKCWVRVTFLYPSLLKLHFRIIQSGLGAPRLIRRCSTE